MPDLAAKRLTASQVYQSSKLTLLSRNCKTTEHIEPIIEIVGQARAQQAVEFAMGMKEKGYNIYAIGQNGLGKRTMMLRYFNRLQGSSPLFDWCYVSNFDNPRTPTILKLPQGQGKSFKEDIEAVTLKLVKALPLSFENELYYKQAEHLKKQLAEKQEDALDVLTKESRDQGIDLVVTSQGDYQLIAMDGDKPHNEESYDKLSDSAKKEIEGIIRALEIKLRKIVRDFTKWEQDFIEKQQSNDEQVAEGVISQFIKPLKRKYKKVEAASKHLDLLQKDMITNLDIFLEQSEEQVALAYSTLDKKMPRRYQVNLLVNQQAEHFPIVVEDNPSYHSLFGYIENATFKGTVFTDFTLIRSGSLHKANGGVLMMDALKVLERPYVWDGLKRALRSRQLDLSSLEREVSLSGAISLSPEPIPLDLKVIMFGDHHTYQLLQQYDPDFCELFKVTADFESDMPRTSDTEQQYARFISSIVHDNNMLHCDRSAIARIVEYSSRQAEDQGKLSLNSANIANLLRESNYCAQVAKSDLIQLQHVEQALDSQLHRQGKMQDAMMESFSQGRTILETTGEQVGQINALVVVSTGEHHFGLPSRITANTAFGDGEVLDVEHKVKLGGQIHSKGVLILTSYLAAQLGKSAEIPLTTYLTFEQSYSNVDGDSASMAECCAVLSAISDTPLKQNIAITGSMDQFGNSQPIGGVNEKIEGFFDVCKLKGRSPDQGVIIPQANVANLMLRSDIVAAIKAKEFNIWSIEHVSQAVKLLSGLKLGTQTKEGFSKGSLFDKAQTKLTQLRNELS
ncbi:MAG: Lon protease family protein [Parashewanella sp.]